MTGGAGFVGAPTAHRLASDGHDVHVIDNLVRGTRARLEPVEHSTPIHLHEADVRDRERIDAVFTEIAPDAVVHLAANHFIPHCIAHPAETLEINVLGTQHVLDAAAQCGVELVFFASTADVYRPAITPHRETDAVQPGNAYGLSKLVGEMLVAHWHAALSEPCRVVVGRLFNVYGPGETNPHVVPEIMDQLRVGDVLRLGNLAPRRDYVWVEDIAAAIAGFVASGTALPADRVTTMNVGTGISVSVSDIVEALARVTGRALRIETDPERVRATDRPNLQADPSSLRACYPNATATELENGLRALVAAEGLG